MAPETPGANPRWSPHEGPIEPGAAGLAPRALAVPGENAPLARRALSGTRKREATSWRAAGLIYPARAHRARSWSQTPSSQSLPKSARGGPCSVATADPRLASLWRQIGLSEAGRRRKGKSGASPRPSILVTPFILLLLSRTRVEKLLPLATAGARVPPVSWANPKAATWRETLGGPLCPPARPSLRRAPGNPPASWSRGEGCGSGRKSCACRLYKDSGGGWDGWRAGVFTKGNEEIGVRPGRGRHRQQRRRDPGTRRGDRQGTAN